jgi:energy-coupling factor transport system permease protein
MVFSLGLAWGSFSSLLFAVSLLCLLALLVGVRADIRSWKMLRRLRWFFLSIAIVYLWFTPGRWLFPELQGWSPTFEGLSLAAQRLAILVTIVFAVGALLRSLSQAQLMAALQQLLQPLAMFGFPAQTFALRLALTVEAAMTTTVGSDVAKVQGETLMQRARGMAAALADKFIAATAVDDNEKEIELLNLPKPAVWQWSVPFMLALLFALLN